AISGGVCGRNDDGMAAEELDIEVERDTVHSGAAAVPHAHALLAGTAATGPGAHFSAAGRHHHPAGDAGAVGAGTLAADAHGYGRDCRAGAGRQPDWTAGTLY